MKQLDFKCFLKPDLSNWGLHDWKPVAQNSKFYFVAKSKNRTHIHHSYQQKLGLFYFIFLVGLLTQNYSSHMFSKLPTIQQKAEKKPGEYAQDMSVAIFRLAYVEASDILNVCNFLTPFEFVNGLFNISLARINF